MNHSDMAAVLAVGAALFIAIGDVIHQRSAHDITDEPVGHLELFTRLLRNGRWWLGSVVAAVGFGLQAAALGLGSVLLVQAVLVSALLFALPMSARLAHRRVTRWEWLWAVVLAGAVAVIVTVGNPQAGESRASLQTWTLVVVVMGPLLVLCVLGARLWPGVGAVLLAVVSGSLWGVFAVLTKGVVDQLDHGVLAELRTPELYALVVVAIAGTAWQQSSFRAGAMTASLPTMTVVEPVVGSALGIFVLGETLKTNNVGWFGLGVAVVAVVVATVALARSAALASDSSEDASPVAAV
ncbi:MAG TPA: DMT family transporter [Mycobacterium sp.]|nr:DMT family transporter [Mycobacterium sp.]